MASLVEKATSDMLIGPDWAMNMEICDIINRDPGLAKEVVKAIKKRLGHRNPKVQLLALTVLETIVKNCGPAVHQQVAEKDVLHEMVKIVKRKTDMHVRDKILVLISSWHEAFGGPRGRYPQYFIAFEELRRLGVEFPDRPAERDAPIFTPPQSHPIQPQPGYGSPANMPSRLEALMSNDLPGLSLSEIETARGRVEVLTEMLNAVNPRDKLALKDELIVELVDQCRSTQQRVMSLVNNTSDEELLRQGLGLNDDLQKVLEKHDAIASGKAPPKDPVPQTTNKPPPAPSKPVTELADGFAQLSMRSPKKADPQPAEDPFVQLALPAPPTPTKSSGTVQKPQDLIDLLSGESLEETSSAPPLPSAPVLPTSSPISPPDVASGNPFGPAFHAVPSTQTSYVQQDQTSQFGSSLPNSTSFASQPQQQQQQQQQQFGANGSTFGSQQFGAVSSPFSSPVGTSFGSQPQQQFAQQPQQQFANGTSFPGANGYHQQQQQQQQQQDSGAAAQQGGFTFPQYQAYSPSQNTSYVAPWALPSDQLSPQQQAMIYGGSVQGSQLPSQPTPAPWAGQQQMYGNYYGYGYGYGYGQQYPYADQYNYQYGASSYYQNGAVSGGWTTSSAENQLALVPVTSSASGSSASKPKDKLFEDLVDMQSLKLKSAGVSRGSL